MSACPFCENGWVRVETGMARCECRTNTLPGYSGFPPREIEIAKKGSAYDPTEAMSRAILEALHAGCGALVVGHCGAGKTAAANRAAVALKDIVEGALYLYWPDWLREIRQGFDTGGTSNGESFQIERATEPDLLLIDDLGAEKSTEWGVSVLHSVLRRRALEKGDKTIVTSNLPMEGRHGDSIMSVYGPRIHSRLKTFNIIPVPEGTPDWRGMRPSPRTNVQPIRQSS